MPQQRIYKDADFNANVDGSGIGIDGEVPRHGLGDYQSGQAAIVDLLRGIKISPMVRLFGDTFKTQIGAGNDAGTFPATVTVAGTGSGSVSGGSLNLSTGGSANGASALLRSTRIAPFITGSVGHVAISANLPTGNTAFKVVSRSSGTDTAVASGSFIDASGATNATYTAIDGKFRLYELFYAGTGTCHFYAAGQLIHKLSGNTTVPTVQSLDLPMAQEIFNAAGTTIVRWGLYDANNGFFFQTEYTAANLTANFVGASANRLGTLTESPISVKPANTLPTAADPAIVVAVRNYPAPVAAAVSIANGTSLSAGVPLNGGFPVGIIVPSGWTAANITFQGSPDGGTTYVNARTSGGSELVVNVTTAGDGYGLNALDFAAYTHIKIRSGIAATPQNQTSTVSLTLSTRDAL